MLYTAAPYHASDAWTTAPPPPITTKKKSPADVDWDRGSLLWSGARRREQSYDEGQDSICSTRLASTCSSTEAKDGAARGGRSAVVVDGVAGVEVVTQRVWGYCNEIDLPRMIVVNRMDRDRADATASSNRSPTPSAAPSLRYSSIGREKSLKGIVDLSHEGLHLRHGRKWQGQEGPIPADMAGVARNS